MTLCRYNTTLYHHHHHHHITIIREEPCGSAMSDKNVKLSIDEIEETFATVTVTNPTDIL